MSDAPRLVFANANLLDGEHEARPRQTVVVEGERIVSVGDAPYTAAPGDRVVDLAGRTLMPGLVTTHFHSTYHDIGISPQPLGLEAPPAVLAIVAEKNLQCALRSGFTSVVSAGGINAFIDPQLKRAITDGLTEGPRMIAGGHGLDIVGGYQDTGKWWWELGNQGSCRYANGPDGFRHLVRDEVRRGVEMVKLFPSGGHGVHEEVETLTFTRDELRAAVHAAHQRGARVRAHCPWKEPMLECLAAGVDVIDHGDRIDAEVLDAMLAADATLVPSAYFIHLMLNDPTNAVGATPVQMAPVRADFENMCKRLPEANAAGLRITVGDDYGILLLPHRPHIYARELAFYVDHVGIPALDVLRWATKHGGELMLEDVGTIATGKLADLLVVDGDPSRDIALLQDDAKLLAIVKGGEFVKDALAGERG